MKLLLIITIIAFALRFVYMVFVFVEYTFAMEVYLQKKRTLLDKPEFQHIATRCHLMQFEWWKIVYLWEWGAFTEFVHCEIDSKILLWEISEHWNDSKNQE